MATLIKIDKNGSKHFEEFVPCDKCQGRGEYWWGAMEMLGNGQVKPQYAGVCYKCNGTGQIVRKWIERTPEYQAKLDARREAKQAKAEAEYQKRLAEEKALREKEEARIKAQKAISQYVGKIGERLTLKCSFVNSAHFETRSYSGFGTETVYIHKFKDADGNVFIWKTGSLVGFEYGNNIDVTGTVKSHSEYMDEKQTVLTRCKIKLAI